MLGEEVKRLDRYGAEYVHIDVMDGMFVPSISFGLPVISSIRPCTEKVFDVHLMIEEPERYIEEFAKAGADIITIHAESTKHINRALNMIREQGCKAGLALNPATPCDVLNYVMDYVDMILVMSVNPGFGGQKYIKESTDKIKDVKGLVDSSGKDIDIEVDGGINKDNLMEVIEAGANVIVAGSAIFNGDIEENIKGFKDIIG